MLVDAAGSPVMQVEVDQVIATAMALMCDDDPGGVAPKVTCKYFLVLEAPVMIPMMIQMTLVRRSHAKMLGRY